MMFFSSEYHSFHTRQSTVREQSSFRVKWNVDEVPFLSGFIQCIMSRVFRVESNISVSPDASCLMQLKFQGNDGQVIFITPVPTDTNNNNASCFDFISSLIFIKNIRPYHSIEICTGLARPAKPVWNKMWQWWLIFNATNLAAARNHTFVQSPGFYCCIFIMRFISLCSRRL